MNIFKKFVNLITEEPEGEEDVDVKVEKIEPEPKKVKPKKIVPKKEVEEKEEIEEFDFTKTIDLESTKELEKTKKLDKTIDLESTKELVEERPTREKIKTPFFSDNDFEDLEVRRPKKVEKVKEPIKKEVDREAKLYNGNNNGYTTGSYTSTSILSQEKATFKVSPVISPVFGILDKNYSKDDIVEKKDQSSYTTGPTRRDKFDEVRNKAYGTLEDEIEDVVYYPEEEPIVNDIDLFDELANEDVKTVEIEDTTDLSSTIEAQEENIKELEEITMDLTKELDNLLLKKETFNEKKEKIEKKSKDEELSENELFNLIDSMYEEGRD